MTTEAPTYDLVLLLDPLAEDDVRARIVAEARAAIESRGELLRHDDWGTRALTYPIDRRTTAEYHLLQFHAGSPELLGTLDRSLRIADEALRFRIVKLRAGVPDPPDMRSTTPPPRPQAEETAQPPTAAAETPAPATEAPAPATEMPAPAAETPASDPAAPASDAEAAAAEAPASAAEAPASDPAMPASDAEPATGERPAAAEQGEESATDAPATDASEGHAASGEGEGPSGEPS